MEQSQRFVAVVELAQILDQAKIHAHRLAEQYPEYEALAQTVAYADDLADMALDAELASGAAKQQPGF